MALIPWVISMRNCQENNQVSVNLEELLSSKEKPFDSVVRTLAAIGEGGEKYYLSWLKK